MKVTVKKKRAPAKVSAPKKDKLPAKEPVAPTPEEDLAALKAREIPQPSAPTVTLVEPLSGPAFQLVMQIIDNADFKGREVQQVIAVKMELARAAGLRNVPGNGQ